jgi:hypothetical protein
LNAEPDADAELPGVSGALALPQDWFGWPVEDGPRIVEEDDDDGVVDEELVEELAEPDAFAPPPAPCAAASAGTSNKAPTARPIVKRFMKSLPLAELLRP